MKNILNFTDELHNLGAVYVKHYPALDEVMSLQDSRVFHYMLSKQKGNVIQIANKIICDDLLIDVSTVKRRKASLCKKGWLKKEQKSYNEVDYYVNEKKVKNTILKHRKSIARNIIMTKISEELLDRNFKDFEEYWGDNFATLLGVEGYMTAPRLIIVLIYILRMHIIQSIDYLRNNSKLLLVASLLSRREQHSNSLFLNKYISIDEEEYLKPLSDFYYEAKNTLTDEFFNEAKSIVPDIKVKDLYDFLQLDSSDVDVNETIPLDNFYNSINMLPDLSYEEFINKFIIKTSSDGKRNHLKKFFEVESSNNTSEQNNEVSSGSEKKQIKPRGRTMSRSTYMRFVSVLEAWNSIEHTTTHKLPEDSEGDRVTVTKTVFSIIEKLKEITNGQFFKKNNIHEFHLPSYEKGYPLERIHRAVEYYKQTYWSLDYSPAVKTLLPTTFLSWLYSGFEQHGSSKYNPTSYFCKCLWEQATPLDKTLDEFKHEYSGVLLKAEMILSSEAKKKKNWKKYLLQSIISIKTDFDYFSRHFGVVYDYKDINNILGSFDNYINEFFYVLNHTFPKNVQIGHFSFSGWTYSKFLDHLTEKYGMDLFLSDKEFDNELLTRKQKLCDNDVALMSNYKYLGLYKEQDVINILLGLYEDNRITDEYKLSPFMQVIPKNA